MNFCSSPFGMAPTARSTSLPSLNIMTVGMEVTPNRCATSGLSSTLSLAMIALSSYVGASSSTKGPMMRQGPHHGAQKSTKAGLPPWITTLSKSLSLTCFTPLDSAMRSPIGLYESDWVHALFQSEFGQRLLVYVVCCMRRMSLIRVLVLAFAWLLTPEPVVHTHPLLTGSGSTRGSVCAVCMSGVGPL